MSGRRASQNRINVVAHVRLVLGRLLVALQICRRFLHFLPFFALLSFMRPVISARTP